MSKTFGHLSLGTNPCINPPTRRKHCTQGNGCVSLGQPASAPGSLCAWHGGTEGAGGARHTVSLGDSKCTDGLHPAHRHGVGQQGPPCEGWKENPLAGGAGTGGPLDGARAATVAAVVGSAAGPARTALGDGWAKATFNVPAREASLMRPLRSATAVSCSSCKMRAAVRGLLNNK